ncbi:MAG: type II toxin-antitoxin system VapC family toxin [Candidatus Aminicenantes bacterium]|nr:type II toxin-antitoxin system VapC family toxin [Candidatus Aminicenantes bacterium]
MLADTDVLIWYLKGNEKAFDIIERETALRLSVVTYMEMVQGMRNKKELNFLRKALKNWDAEIIYINEEISIEAMFFVEQHYLSHSLQLADALIAATAVLNGLSLLTGNDRHYKMIKNLQIEIFRP